MASKRFKRSAAPFFAITALAAAMAVLAMGQTHAQPVNPVPPPPGPPAVNSVTPTPSPPPPPVAPVSPTTPAPSTAPGSVGVVPPVSPAPRTKTATETAKPHLSRIHARHHGRIRVSRWGHHVHFVLADGPSYYPGLGLVPPFVHPCHFAPTWYAYYGEWLSYTCSR